ncbi:cupin-like domain-containing protein [Mucilaginibacter aurantiaciroseus]|uniref:cupin-like domain-containing protein n=1 Tax=Mucilaginibacter aurantiaciroseus TaxID=2949308 RepID=UPI003518CBF8
MNNYLKSRKPLVIRKATQNWPALQKWTFDYLKEAVFWRERLRYIFTLRYRPGAHLPYAL